LEIELANALGLGRRSGPNLPDQMHSLGNPVRTRVVSRDTREKDKDWIFKTPEELAKPPTTEELLNLQTLSPEEQERQKLSPMERYFESLESQRSLGVKSGKVTDEDLFGPKWRSDRSKTDARRKAEDELTAGIQQREQSLRDILNPGSGDAAAASQTRSFREIFGSSRPDGYRNDSFNSSRNTRAAYEELYDPLPVATANPAPFGGSGAEASAAASYNPGSQPAPGANGFSSYLNPASMRGSSASPFSSGTRPIFSPGGMQEANAQALNSWNSAAQLGPQRTDTAPKPRQPFVPPSNFETPQRSF
jgi:hypothetical protein